MTPCQTSLKTKWTRNAPSSPQLGASAVETVTFVHAYANYEIKQNTTQHTSHRAPKARLTSLHFTVTRAWRSCAQTVAQLAQARAVTPLRLRLRHWCSQSVALPSHSIAPQASPERCVQLNLFHKRCAEARDSRCALSAQPARQYTALHHRHALLDLILLTGAVNSPYTAGSVHRRSRCDVSSRATNWMFTRRV